MSFFGNTSAQQPKVEKKLANISEDAINSNQQGIPVTYLAGRSYVTGNYISPAYNPKAVPIQTQTGKSEKQTTGYKYYADFALVFCLGGRHPVDAVYKVIVDSEIAWSGNITRGNANKEVITVEKFGVIHLYWGTETQNIDNVLLTPRSVAIGGGNTQDATTWPANEGPNPYQGLPAGDPNPYSGHYDKHPAYRGQCYAVFIGWKLGRDRTSVPNIALELKRGCPWFLGQSIASSNLGVNPAAVLYDWLTDTRFGMALPDDRLNMTTFVALYNQLEAQGARIAPVITSQSDFRQVVAQFLEYYDGWIRSKNGKLEVGMWSHGTVASAGTLTDDDLLGEPELEPQGWGPTTNEVTVIYSDRDHHYSQYSQTHRDPNNFRITGGPRPLVLQRPWLRDAALAKKYVREYGAIAALPTTRGNLAVKREWLTNRNIYPGDVFIYQSGFYGLSFYLRLLEVEFEGDDSAVASLTVEWERAIWPGIFVPTPFQGPGGFVIGPRAITSARITEVPYTLLDNNFLTQCVALARRQNVEISGFRVWASNDAGATYANVSNVNSFAAFGRTASGISDTGNYFWVRLYGVDLDQVVSQPTQEVANDTLLAFWDSEVMSVGAVISYGSGLYQIYVLRARLGTPRAFHSTDTDVYFIMRDKLVRIDSANFIPGVQIKFKLQPFTAEDEYDLSAITPINYTIEGWASLPSPSLNPPAQTFASSLHIDVAAVTGITWRYTSDGAAVTGGSPVFPAAGINITATTTLRVRGFTGNGRYTGELVAVYTKVAGSTEATVAVVQHSFSGNQHQTGGNLTLTCATAGATIKYRKNFGAITTYSAPIALVCDASGDVVERWGEKAGMNPSPHRTFDNTRYTPGGGGGGVGINPDPP